MTPEFKWSRSSVFSSRLEPNIQCVPNKEYVTPQQSQGKFKELKPWLFYLSISKHLYVLKSMNFCCVRWLCVGVFFFLFFFFLANYETRKWNCWDQESFVWVFPRHLDTKLVHDIYTSLRITMLAFETRTFLLWGSGATNSATTDCFLLVISTEIVSVCFAKCRSNRLGSTWPGIYKCFSGIQCKWKEWWERKRRVLCVGL